MLESRILCNGYFMIRFHDLKWFLFCTGRCQVQPLGTSEWRHCLCWPPLLGNPFHGLHFQTWNSPGTEILEGYYLLFWGNVFPSNCFTLTMLKVVWILKKLSTQHEVINTRRTDINTGGYYKICLQNNGHYLCRKQNSLHKSFVERLVRKLPRTFLTAFFGTLVQPASYLSRNLPQSLHRSYPGTICNRNLCQQPCWTRTLPETFPTNLAQPYPSLNGTCLLAPQPSQNLVQKPDSPFRCWGKSCFHCCFMDMPESFTQTSLFQLLFLTMQRWCLVVVWRCPFRSELGEGSARNSDPKWPHWICSQFTVAPPHIPLTLDPPTSQARWVELKDGWVQGSSSAWELSFGEGIMQEFLLVLNHLPVKAGVIVVCPGIRHVAEIEWSNLSVMLWTSGSEQQVSTTYSSVGFRWSYLIEWVDSQDLHPCSVLCSHLI